MGDAREYSEGTADDDREALLVVDCELLEPMVCWRKMGS